MAKSRPLPLDHRPFATLPAGMITVGRGTEQMAVHVAGDLRPGRLPVICVGGYQRNMADFSELVRLAAPIFGPQTPIILVDLKGRGRSADRARIDEYSSLNDAGDLIEITRALAIERAVFLGQGYGGQVLMALAAVALLVAGVGIYGTLAYAVAQRRHEIGLRLALGADPAWIARAVVRDGLAIVLLGLIPGLLAAFAAGRYMSSMLFGVQPTDPATIAVTVVACVTVSLCGALLPALRAVRVSPMSVLRSE